MKSFFFFGGLEHIKSTQSACRTNIGFVNNGNIFQKLVTQLFVFGVLESSCITLQRPQQLC